MRSRAVLLGCLLSVLTSHSALAQAQAQQLFGSGRPLLLKENDVDRRFLRTRLAHALYQGTTEPACAELMGGLLTIVGEAAPLLHNRDENVSLHPALINALNTQLSTPIFTAATYFTLMMRRIRLDGHVPAAWAAQAAALNPLVQTIDMGKIRLLAEGIRPIDSAYLTLPVLHDRFETEVERANSAAAASAYAEFRDLYLDHEVAFGELTLLDISLPDHGGDLKGALGPVVTAEWLTPDMTPTMPSLDPMKGRTKILIKGRLAMRQYVDLARFPKGHRVMLRGRFWDINRTGTELELREALLFEDRDWSHGAVLGNPGVVQNCSAALNDLQGIGQGPNSSGLR